jgi:hypothetical protein
MDDMKDEQLNRWATEYMGTDWHVTSVPYCSDSSPRSLVADLEKKVIEEKGSNRYWRELNIVVENYPDGMVTLLTAGARTRVLACWRAVNGE